MKFFIFLLPVILCLSAFGQSYDSLMAQGINMVNQKDYTGALVHFKSAFADTLQSGPYDLYYGVKAALQCNERELAFQWLSLAQRKGLGLGLGELLLIEKDPALALLHNDPRWPVFISTLQKAYSDKEAADKKATDEWMVTVRKNRIKGKKDGKYRSAPHGFALYFNRADSIEVPYLVYVPSAYTGQEPAKAIVFLHGGVNSHNIFRDEDPHTAHEPIFSIADSLHAIIIYPFGRSSFGWVNQKKAFEHVLETLKDVARNYNIDEKQVYMSGLSNGGTACFWFASQPVSPFRGYLALSALPKLNIGEIDFARIGADGPFITVHAKDDDTFPYDQVSQIYAAEASRAKGWKFLTLESGGHGFIYNEHGKDLLLQYMEQMMR